MKKAGTGLENIVKNIRGECPSCKEQTLFKPLKIDDVDSVYYCTLGSHALNKTVLLSYNKYIVRCEYE